MGDLPPRQSPSPPPPPPPPIPRLRSPPSPVSYEVLFSEPPDVLPEPLPSIETIEESPSITDLPGKHTATVLQSYVVKYGTHVEQLEADTMRFVRHTRPTIRIPRVFAVYKRNRQDHYPGCITYIIMEKIPGQTLHARWATLSKDEKQGFAEQLRDCLESLRTIPHQGMFACLNNAPLPDIMFTSVEPDPAINGPFANEQDLIAGMINKYERDGTEVYLGAERIQYRVAYFRQVTHKVFLGAGEPTFTHCDIQRKNIMVQPDGRIALIDWAASGWYPQYWEYAVAICACVAWEDDWSTYIAVAMDEYPNHYAWMNMIRMELWG